MVVVPARLDARRRRWWRPVVAAAAGGVVAVAGWAVPAAAHEAAVGSVSAAGGYIVRAEPGQLAAVVDLLEGRHLRVQRRIGIIEAAVVTLPAGVADVLAGDPRVAAVTPNAAVTLQAGTYDAVADVNSLYNNENATKVRQMWSKGYTGAGVDVALIDSGVAPVAGLADPGKIINGPDLTEESQSAGTRYLDTPTAMARTWPGSSPGTTAVW
jgi:serine protease AprX